MIDDKGYLIKANLYDGLDCDDDIIFYQNDTKQSKIIAEFTGKKRAAIDIADCTVVCVIQKSDKEIVTAYMENDFNVANRAEYVLSQNALASTGKGVITIFVYGSDNERQTFGSIKFKVLKDVNSGSVESTTEYPVLTKLISDAKVATNGAESAKNEILGISADIANAEKQRNIAETKREESEGNRSKEFTGIKKEYESLKSIMIDENNAANLQNQINEANSQLENIVIEKADINKGVFSSPTLTVIQKMEVQTTPTRICGSEVGRKYVVIQAPSNSDISIAEGWADVLDDNGSIYETLPSGKETIFTSKSPIWAKASSSVLVLIKKEVNI